MHGISSAEAVCSSELASHGFNVGRELDGANRFPEDVPLIHRCGMDASAAQIVAATNGKADQMLALTGIISVGVAEDTVTQLYTTAAALEEELAVVEWATDAVEPFPGARTAEQMKERVNGFAERELSPGQLQAATVAAGDVGFELVDGPAGTGKNHSVEGGG